MKTNLLGAALVAAALSLEAIGHAGGQGTARHDYAAAEETAFGKAHDPRKAMRTIAIDMADTMRFTPSEITLKRGETVRFVAKNSGKLMHEMVLGTRKDLEAHAEAMMKHPGMEHDEPNMLHVAPGKTGELGWRFTRAGEFYYGCLVPGHFAAGMIGRIVVK